METGKSCPGVGVWHGCLLLGSSVGLLGCQAEQRLHFDTYQCLFSRCCSLILYEHESKSVPKALGSQTLGHADPKRQLMIRLVMYQTPGPPCGCVEAGEGWVSTGQSWGPVVGPDPCVGCAVVQCLAVPWTWKVLCLGWGAGSRKDSLGCVFGIALACRVCPREGLQRLFIPEKGPKQPGL